MTFGVTSFMADRYLFAVHLRRKCSLKYSRYFRSIHYIIEEEPCDYNSNHWAYVICGNSFNLFLLFREQLQMLGMAEREREKERERESNKKINNRF